MQLYNTRLLFLPRVRRSTQFLKFFIRVHIVLLVLKHIERKNFKLFHRKNDIKGAREFFKTFDLDNFKLFVEIRLKLFRYLNRFKWLVLPLFTVIFQRIVLKKFAICNLECNSMFIFFL